MKNNLLKIKILTRLITLIFNSDSHKAIKQYILLFEGIRSKSGIKYAIKYIKVCKLHITRYISGVPLKSNSAGVALDKDYFPKRLNLLKELLVKNEIRSVLTILSYSRSVIPTKSEEKSLNNDYSSITNKYKGKVYTIPKWFIEDFVDKFNLKLNKPVYDDKDHYVSMKGSPNGPATYSSWWSVLNLNYTQQQYIINIIGDYYSKWFAPLYTSSFNNLDTMPERKKDSNFTGKLSIVKDPELKRRVIAMVDYTTQFCLRPIHSSLLKIIKNFECDRTFTQDPFHNWKEDENKFYSLDLSSATDRFPIELQKKLLLYIYKKDITFVNSWKDLLVNRLFLTPEGDTIKYSVGQPMGAYSSWIAFTITHHLVVHYAAYLCGYNEFKDYILLGDDIVIKNDKVANKYITLMTRFGVDISVAKTHVSSDTYEFAKRWIKSGKEVSGIPLKGLLTNWNNPFIVYLELFNYFQKVPINRENTLNIVGKLYHNLPYKFKVMRNHNFKNVIRLLYDFHYGIKFAFGNLTYDEFRNYIMIKNPKDNFNIPNENNFLSYMKGILSEGLVDEASTSSTSMLTQFNKFKTKFEGLENINELSTWPVTLGFYNHLDSLESKVQDYRDGNVGLIDSSMSMRVNNFDKIANMHRNKSEAITSFGKLWKKSIAIAQVELDEWSLMTKPWLLDGDLHHISPWESALKTNITFAKQQFKTVISKSIVIEKEEVQSNDWASFFK